MILNFLCRFSRAHSILFSLFRALIIWQYLLLWNIYPKMFHARTVVLLETSYPTAFTILTSWVAVFSSSTGICFLMMAKMLGVSLKQCLLPRRRERVPCILYFLIVANTVCFGTIYIYILLLPGLWPHLCTITVAWSTVAQSIVCNTLITPFSVSSFANTESWAVRTTYALMWAITLFAID